MFKRHNIWFLCPACEKKLVVGAQAAGLRAECPECGEKIPIPTRSTVWPTWLKKIGVFAAQVLVVVIAAFAGWQFAVSGAEDHDTFGAASSVSTNASPAGTEESAMVRPVSPDPVDVNTQLLGEHVELQGKYNRMVQWMLENYRGKYPLPERLVERLRISPLTEENDVHPDLVEMLRMTDEEKTLVQDIFNYVRAGFDTAELERVQVTERQENRITFSIPNYPDLGSGLKEDLFLALESTLGSSRFDRMVDVAGEEMRERFHYFGEASRTLTFEVIQPNNPGDHPPYVLIRDGWVIPEGESIRLTKVTETAITTLPTAYHAYADWLPDTVYKYTSKP